MIFQFTTKIKAFQTRCIKTRQKHIENNENIYRKIFLEVINYLLPRFFIICIMKNDSGFQWSVLWFVIHFRFTYNIRTIRKFYFDRFRLIFLPFFLKYIIQPSCLLSCFADNHAAQGLITLYLAKFFQVIYDIASQLIYIARMLDDFRFANIFFLY